MSVEIAIVQTLFIQTFLGETVSEKTSWCFSSDIFPIPSSAVSEEPQMQKLWCRCIHWAPQELVTSAECLVGDGSDGLHAWKKILEALGTSPG